MFKTFFGCLCLSACLLCAAPGCNGPDDGRPPASPASDAGIQSGDFNPYDQQPNQTAVDNN